MNLLKETSYSDRRFSVSCILFIIIGGILVLFIYITRLASNKIFSPSNKTHREVGGLRTYQHPGSQCSDWATGWMNKKLLFNCWQGQGIYLLQNI